MINRTRLLLLGGLIAGPLFTLMRSSLRKPIHLLKGWPPNISLERTLWAAQIESVRAVAKSFL